MVDGLAASVSRHVARRPRDRNLGRGSHRPCRRRSAGGRFHGLRRPHLGHGHPLVGVEYRVACDAFHAYLENAAGAESFSDAVFLYGGTAGIEDPLEKTKAAAGEGKNANHFIGLASVRAKLWLITSASP